ncbi:MAG: hypothetical protein RL318_2315 [Fibrobacterota bacterium]|jgi:RND family efflux transporter MFP subunit
MRHLKRHIALLGLGSLILLGCSGKKDGNAPARSGVAGPAALRDVARLTGTIQPMDSVQLKSEVSGQIKRMLVKEGAFVKKGDLLLEIDREQLELRHSQLGIALEKARLDLRSAERDLARAQSQLASGTASHDRVQDTEILRDKARLSVKNAELDLRSNAKDLANTRILAPQDGQLIRLNVTTGEVAISAASASGGNVLGVIADPSRLKVVVEVSELDYPRLKLGQSVEISTESQSDRLIEGTVSYIPPSARASSSNSQVMIFPVQVALNLAAPTRSLLEVASSPAGRGGSGKRGPKGNRDSSKVASKDSSNPGKRTGRKASVDTSKIQLVSGMTVNVDFVFLERKAALAVPYDLVQTSTDGARKTVRVRGEKGLRPQPVKVGATDYRSIEILEGLKAGDSVFAASDSAKSGAKKGAGGPP